ncbi:MAG: hypothetical protein J6Q22_09495 [Prevotella sp.]|nr:hypothetical protein [Prevotella sp.]
MFGFLKKLFAPVATYDGCDFYSVEALLDYKRKERLRREIVAKGLNRYTVHANSPCLAREAMDILDQSNCFNYELMPDGETVVYYASVPLVVLDRY